MFQDIKPARHVVRTRQLVVPERGAGNSRRSSSTQYSYSISRTVISDVVALQRPAENQSAPTSEATEEVVHVESSVVTETLIADIVTTSHGVSEPDFPVDTKEDIAKIEDSVLLRKDEGQLSQKSQKRNKKTRPSPSVKKVTSNILIAVVLIAFAYISVDTFLTNRELKRRLEALPAVVSSADATPEQRQQAEGADESEPSGSAMSKYVVAPDMPRYITIKKSNTKGRVLQMGINPDGSMQAPLNIFDAGWYNGSAKPGTDGAAVIDAHASGPTRQGLFAYLNTLKDGDEIVVEMGDKSEITYKVVHTEKLPKGEVDMSKLMKVYGSAKQGLNLITCDGRWVKDESTFSDRAMVYTERV